MGDVYSLGLWCAANLFMFIVILAKNDALNEETLNLATRNLRRLMDEISHYIFEPSGCPIEFTSNLNFEGNPRLARPHTIPSSSHIRPKLRRSPEGRVSIEEHVQKYKKGPIPEEKFKKEIDKKTKNNIDEQLTKILDEQSNDNEENKPSTKKLEQLCEEYREEKKTFDKEIEEFQTKLDENVAGIVEVKKAAVESRKLSQTNPFENIVSSSVKNGIETQKNIDADIRISDSLEQHNTEPNNINNKRGSEQSDVIKDNVPANSNKKEIKTEKSISNKRKGKINTSDTEQSSKQSKPQTPICLVSDVNDNQSKSNSQIGPTASKRDTSSIGNELKNENSLIKPQKRCLKDEQSRKKSCNNSIESRNLSSNAPISNINQTKQKSEKNTLDPESSIILKLENKIKDMQRQTQD